MANRAGDHTTTFVGTKSGEMKIRMMEHHADGIIEAAKTLGARYFVTQDGFDERGNTPIWGVFMTDQCEKFLNQWKLPRPLRTFFTETDDAAVMFACSKMRT